MCSQRLLVVAAEFEDFDVSDGNGGSARENQRRKLRTFKLSAQQMARAGVAAHSDPPS